MTTLTLIQAQDALMEAMEDWAKSLGEQGYTKSNSDARYFPTRTIPAMRTSHRAGTLLADWTGWLSDYKELGHSQSAMRMVDIVKCGLRPWEHVLLEPNQPWSGYVTAAQKAALHQVMSDCHAAAARELRLVATIRAQAVAPTLA